MFEKIHTIMVGQSFEFYTNYTLAECKQIFEDASERQEEIFLDNRLMTKVQNNTDKFVDFELYQDELKIKVTVRQDDIGAYVSGKIYVHAYLTPVLFLAFPLFCTRVTSWAVGIIPAILMCLLMGITVMIAILFSEIQRMDEKIHYMLGKSKKKI